MRTSPVPERVPSHQKLASETSPIAATLARLSAEEMVEAVGLGRAPSWVRRAALRAFHAASLPLGQTLAKFDEAAAALGVHLAARQALTDLGAEWICKGSVPAQGPIVVVANHPGAFDTLVLLAALGRADVAIIAADRHFLRALPTFSEHLLLIPEAGNCAERATGLRRARRHLLRGGVLLHFGAGRIEPDPAFAPEHLPRLLRWGPGTGALVRGAGAAQGLVIAALVSGVHSPRAKRLLVTRVAERFGLTTLCPLLQIAIPRYHDVKARVSFSEPQVARTWAGSDLEDATLADQVRALAAGLTE